MSDYFIKTLHRDHGQALYTKKGARGLDDESYAVLADALDISGETAVDLNPGLGLVVSALSQRGFRVEAKEWSRTCLDLLEASFSENPNVSISRGMPWDLESREVDIATLVIPFNRGTPFVELSLWSALRLLKTGGRLWMVGSSEKGFDHYFKLAQQMFGFGTVILRDKRLRVAVFEKEKPESVMPPIWLEFTEEQKKYRVLQGVFSSNHIDAGTRFLLDQLNHHHPGDLGHILDIGAGYGAISTNLAERAQSLTLLEDDWASVLSAEKNLEHVKISTRVLHSDVDGALTPGQTFTTVVTNPPFHVGGFVVLDTAVAFLEAAHQRLESGGKLYLVANSFLPYEPLLHSRFASVKTLATQNFKVLMAQK